MSDTNKWIKYRILCGNFILDKRIGYNEKNLAIAKKEAYGGSNAYEIISSNESYKPIGSVAKTLLWDNSNQLGQYAANTISIDNLNNYDGIEIVYIAGYYDFNIKSSGFIPRIQSSNALESRCFVLDAIDGDSGSKASVHRRTGSFNSTTITFDDCIKCDLDGSQMTVHNFGCIPYKIYGVKGVI